MDILQVYQAKALKDLDEGSPDPEVLQEMHSATDYAFQAAEVKAQALGQAMSTLVVKEHHLWLNLVEMKDAKKVLFLDAPLSQDGLFGNTVEEFSKQFLAVKNQTEAFKHILPRHGATSRGARTRGKPSLSPTGEVSQLRVLHRLRLSLGRQPDCRGLLANRWCHQPILRSLRTFVRLLSVPEISDPGHYRLRISLPFTRRASLLGRKE